MDCFTRILVGVIKAINVNLTEIELMFSGTVNIEYIWKQSGKMK
jgi:hypothetical protein